MIEARQNRLETKVNLLLAIGILQAIFGAAKLYIAHPGNGPTVPAHQTQSVKIGEATTAPSDHAEYLTVAQVAKELGLAERTVLTAIAEDRIFPEPRKPGGRAWAIDRNYRYQPPTTADSR